MKFIWRYINAHQNIIYKALLIFCSSLLILYLFPKGGQFKYEFQKGKPWQYPTYYAPFDFSILKTDQQLAEDKKNVSASIKPYYRVDLAVFQDVVTRYKTQFDRSFKPLKNKRKKEALFSFGRSMLDTIYKTGVIPPSLTFADHTTVFLIRANTASEINIDSFFNPEALYDFVKTAVDNQNLGNTYTASLYELLFELILPNIALDKKFTDESEKEALLQIPIYRDFIKEGQLIIAQGVVVEGEQFQILESLRQEVVLQAQDGNATYWIIFGYIILIVLTFFLLLMFIKKYRSAIYENNRKLTFIFFNILVIVAITTLVVNFDVAYIYAVPICILPLIIKAFFDPRLGLFTHVLTILLIGFIVPNSFEFIFLQIVAGIITIQSITQLYRRASLFISVALIVLVYLVAYVAFTVIQEGTILGVEMTNLFLFILNGLITLFVQPLIYIYEKIFRLVSDVSLLELSDTNSTLLKELSDKAPGTFHHSLQVANLAEAAANEIGANSLLVRVGALYHDIGKLTQSHYFSENQKGSVSPHEDLTPKQSAAIIINHVSEGIALAKKYDIPDRIIDFIRTHHGTSMVYYFYKKEMEKFPDTVKQEDFRYKGPKPFSKETAILMISDAVEAASKSLRNPDLTQLQTFIDKIVTHQMEEKQFDASNITLGEIEIVKKVIFKKLINVYQLRIEYPE